MLTAGVSLPLTSSTASVARSPVTSLRGKSRMRAPDAGGACCAAQQSMTLRLHTSEVSVALADIFVKIRTPGL